MKYILFSLVLFSRLSLGVEIDGVTFPDTMSINGKKLILNGTGIRKYSIFKVKIYFAALYLEKKESISEKITKSPGAKIVLMHFKKPVGESDMREAWRHYLQENAGDTWTQQSIAAEKYLKILPGVKEQDVMTHEFLPGKVVLKLNDKTVGEVADKAFPPLLLSTWIGEKPTTEEMKRGLLGLPEE